MPADNVGAVHTTVPAKGSVSLVIFAPTENESTRPGAQRRSSQTAGLRDRGGSRRSEPSFFFSRLLLSDLCTHGVSEMPEVRSSPLVGVPQDCGRDISYLKDFKLYHGWLHTTKVRNAEKKDTSRIKSV